MSKETVDLMLDNIVNICRIGASPGGPQLLEALFPGTQEAVRKAQEPRVQRCPCCRTVHPNDIACKALERLDNGGW